MLRRHFIPETNTHSKSVKIIGMFPFVGKIGFEPIQPRRVIYSHLRLSNFAAYPYVNHPDFSLLILGTYKEDLQIL